MKKPIIMAGLILATSLGTMFVAGLSPNGGDVMADIGPRTPLIDIKNDKLSDKFCIKIDDQMYTGEAIEPEVKVYFKNTDDIYLISGTVTYSNNVKVGTAKVRIDVDGDYLEGTFNIVKCDISQADLDIEKIKDYTYTGSDIKPDPVIKLPSGKKLVKGTDYTLTYDDTRDAGTKSIYIKGKGNFKGEREIRFKILPKTITADMVRLGQRRCYDGIEPGYLYDDFVKIFDNGYQLNSGNEYNYTFVDDPASHKGKVTIEGMGNKYDQCNYKGTLMLEYDLPAANITTLGKVVFDNGDTYAYTGSSIKPAFKLYIGSELVDPADYTYSYYKNVEPGMAQLVISPKSPKLTNTLIVEYKIIKDMTDEPLFCPNEFISHGEPVKPVFGDLKEGTDYDMTCSNTMPSPDTVTCTVNFKGFYKGTRTFKYKIYASIEDAQIGNVVYFYDKEPSKCRFTVDLTCNGNLLTEETDYKVVTSTVDTAKNKITFKIKGIGIYRGSIGMTLDYQDLWTKLGTINVSDVEYTGSPVTPEVWFESSSGSKTMLSDVYYMGVKPTVTYLNNTEVGTGTVKLNFDEIGMGLATDFNITTASLKAAKITGLKDQYTLSDKAIKPSVKVYLGDRLLVKDRDYKLEYGANNALGNGNVNVIGINNYKDSVNATFKIVAAPTPTTKATATPVPTATTKVSKPSATPAAKPSTAPEVTAAPSDDPKAQILSFVERIYIYVLDREPEAEGAKFWSDELWSFRRTGAEVAQGFIFSPEFESRGTSDKEFVTILYKTFFGRDPEDTGLEFWLSQLSSGAMDRVTVANGFIYSQEWADTCASYGIRSGGELKPTGAIAPTSLTYAFVERLYTTALGRGYDEEGRQHWASALANFEVTGESAGAFFFLSEEMNNYGLSDQEFLSRLYATFMNREPDEDGSAYWLGILASGTPRADVVFGFTRSPEFTDKCIEARILPY